MTVGVTFCRDFLAADVHEEAGSKDMEDRPGPRVRPSFGPSDLWRDEHAQLVSLRRLDGAGLSAVFLLFDIYYFPKVCKVSEILHLHPIGRKPFNVPDCTKILGKFFKISLYVIH